MHIERCHRFIPLGAVVTSLFALVGCMIESSYDISADLRQEFPLDSGTFSCVDEGGKKVFDRSIVRTVDGYDALPQQAAGAPARRVTMRVFRMPNYNSFVLQDASFTDTTKYRYLFTKITRNGFDFYAFDNDEIASANLSRLVRSGDIAVFTPVNPARDTLKILRELSKIEMRKVFTCGFRRSSPGILR